MLSWLQSTKSVASLLVSATHDFYLVADVGKLEGLNKIGLQSKTLTAFVLLDSYVHAPQALDLGVDRQTAEANFGQT